MTIIATIRPDSWNFPLFLHVLGAMILVGGLLTGAGSLAFARGDVKYLRLGYWSLLAVSLPGWVLMRAGAQWIASREGWTKKGVPSPTWLDIGSFIADAGGAILLVSLVAGGVGVRRLRRARAQPCSRPRWCSPWSCWERISSPCGPWPASPTSRPNRVPRSRVGTP